MDFEPFEIVNEDGTSIDFELPEFPLKEKWDRLYPPTKDGEPCWGYRCMYCHRCPSGEYWKVPEEDKEVWEQYQIKVREYNKIHNPSLYKMVYEDLLE